MEVTALELASYVMSSASTLARWENGFSITRVLDASGWRVDCDVDEDWIRLSGPVTRMADVDAHIPRDLLARNDETGASRFALLGDVLVLRADYPTHNFDRAEFTWVYERVWIGLLAAAQALGIDKPPVGDVHT